jgi:hypothetical protein
MYPEAYAKHYRKQNLAPGIFKSKFLETKMKGSKRGSAKKRLRPTWEERGTKKGGSPTPRGTAKWGLRVRVRLLERWLRGGLAKSRSLDS